MNKTKIEFCDYVYNPITGCERKCWYCWYFIMAHRFHWSTKPKLHKDRLLEPNKVQKPGRVFVCSVADIFGPWTKPEWVHAVMASILACPVKHTWLFITKSPERIKRYPYVWKNMGKIWMGTTITNNREGYRLDHILEVGCDVRFAIFEPLLGPINRRIKDLDWIIIGKLTGFKAPFEKAWVSDLLAQARRYEIPVFIKENVGWPEKVQNYPKVG